MTDWLKDASNNLQQVTSAVPSSSSSFGWSSILGGIKDVSNFATENKGLLELGKFGFDAYDTYNTNKYAKKAFDYNKSLTDRTIAREDADDSAIDNAVTNIFKKKKLANILLFHVNRKLRFS